MSRILLLILLIWVLYIVVKRFISKSTPMHTPKESDSETEKIVACNQCGLHIPESESRLVGDLVVCNNPKCNSPQ